MNIWVTIYRCAWGALILLLIVVLVSFFIPKCQTLREYQKRRDDLAEDNRRTAAVVDDLKSRQERFSTDPEFVERTAREAGMVKPDEIVFKFTNAAPLHAPPVASKTQVDH